MEICNKLYCTGCGACANLCPSGCIEMKEDEIGHLYPVVNEDKCISCGLCQKRCPVNSVPKAFPPKKAYAVWSLDENEHKTSTSGGFANVASRKILSEGGVVYGSALTEKQIEHIRVDSLEKLKLLQGSKYVQSPICGIYKSLKEDLESGRKVLFVGTPCQVAGVRAYLNKDYENLYILSLICMGVPPQKLLWEELGYVDKKPQKLSFRDSEGSFLTVFDNNKVIYRKPAHKNYYFKGFTKKLHLRESCYACSFKGMDRASDATIGDFWGLGKAEPFKHEIKNGVSLVMPHTEKGETLINECRKMLFIEERTVDEALRSNSMYKVSAKKHPNHDKYKQYYLKRGCVYAAKRLLLKERLYSFVYQNMRVIKGKLIGKK